MLDLISETFQGARRVLRSMAYYDLCVVFDLILIHKICYQELIVVRKLSWGQGSIK